MILLKKINMNQTAIELIAQEREEQINKVLNGNEMQFYLAC